VASDPVKEARALSHIGFFASSVHPAHAHIGRPERYTEDKSAFPGIQAMARKAFTTTLSRSMRCYVGREWLSDTYSVLDPYAFVFFTWASGASCP